MNVSLLPNIDWNQLYLSTHEILRMVGSALLNPEIMSAPLLVTVTAVITLLWAEKIPSLPFHFERGRLILGADEVKAWQRGLIARNIDQTLNKVLTNRGELLTYLGQESMSRQAEQSLTPHIEEYVDEVMTTDFSIVWENLPPLLKRRAYRRATEGLPLFIDNLVEDISHNSDKLLDYRQMTDELLQQHPLKIESFYKTERLYRHQDILMRCVHLSLLCSIPCMALLTYAMTLYGSLFSAPLSIITGVVLLQMIALIGALFLTFQTLSYSPSRRRCAFKPLLSRNRSRAIAQQAELISFQILKLNQIVRHLFKGPNIPLTQKLIRKHLHPLIETFFTKVIIQLFFGLSGFLRLKKQATEKVALLADYPFEDRSFQEDRAKRLNTLLTERMESLPESEITALLQPFIDFQMLKTLFFSLSAATTMALIQLYILY